MKSRPQIPILLSVIFSSGLYAQEEKAPTMSEAKLRLDVRRLEARKPLKEFQDKYDRALGKLAETAQREGNLDAVLEIRGEREKFRSSSDDEQSVSYQGLTKLREIYKREVIQVKSRIAEKDVGLLKEFISELEIIVAELTKAGDLDEALKVRDQIKKIENEIQSTQNELFSAGGRSGEILILGETENYEKIGVLPIEVSKTADGYTLSSRGDSTRVQSKVSFQPPFTVQARAKTDSTNIRIHFCQRGLVIFNWEKDHSRLRIHDPVTGKSHDGKRNGGGKLKKDQFYNIEIRVTDRTIEVYADGEIRGEIEGDFSKADGPVGIGPAKGAEVTVKSFTGVLEQG